MDFKVLSKFIILSGVAVVLYACFQYAFNQPIKSIKNSGNFFEDFDNSINAMSANSTREAQRENAKNIALIGGIVTFVGFAVRASSKNN